MTFEECREQGIPTYADNDGGLWYWDEDGCTQTVEEDEE